MEKDFNFFQQFNEKGRKKSKQGNSTQNYLLPAILIVALVATAFNVFYSKNQTADLEKEIEENKNMLNEISGSEELKLTNELEAYKMELDSYNKMLSDAYIDRFKIDYRYLLGINNSLSLDLFLETIHLLESTVDQHSSVSGYSIANTNIADFQNNIRQNQYFENEYIDMITQDESKGFGFSLFFDLTREGNENEN